MARKKLNFFGREQLDITIRDSSGRKEYRDRGEPKKVLDRFFKKYGKGFIKLGNATEKLGKNI
jgi:hypothetical protein